MTTAIAKEVSADPQWAEIPRNGTLHGLKRGMLHLLSVPCQQNGRKPLVRSILVKAGKKSKRGKRLINIPSLLAYLESERLRQNPD